MYYNHVKRASTVPLCVYRVIELLMKFWENSKKWKNLPVSSCSHSISHSPHQTFTCVSIVQLNRSTKLVFCFFKCKILNVYLRLDEPHTYTYSCFVLLFEVLEKPWNLIFDFNGALKALEKKNFL